MTGYWDIEEGKLVWKDFPEDLLTSTEDKGLWALLIKSYGCSPQLFCEESGVIPIFLWEKAQKKRIEIIKENPHFIVDLLSISQIKDYITRKE